MPRALPWIAGRFEGRSPRGPAIIVDACCCSEEASDSPDLDRLLLTFLEEAGGKDDGDASGGRMFSWGLFLPLPPPPPPLLVREIWPRCVFAIFLVIPAVIA